MQQFRSKACPILLATLVVALQLTCPRAPVEAAISTTGNVEPTDPASWNSGTTCYIGRTSTGSMTIDSGSSLISCVAWIGLQKNVTGTVTVTGSGSTWTKSSQIGVGSEGCGTLNILAGGIVSDGWGLIGGSSGSTGTVTVDGAGSTWTNTAGIQAGGSGTGTLNVTNGGTVICNGGVDYIGSSYHSTGTVNVDGAGSTWTSSGSISIGSSGNGALNITNGGAVSSNGCYLCGGTALTAKATVTGNGSTWTNSGDLRIGSVGNAALYVNSGGAASVAGTTYLLYHATSAGTIDFGSGGGTLTTGSLAGSSTQLKGTGTINARGIVSDLSPVFDSTDSLVQTFVFKQSGQNVTLNLNLASDPSTNGDLGVGWQGSSSLTIKNGIAVTSRYGYLGYASGSTGSASIDGAASTWNNTDLNVGLSGCGTLSITNHGSVNSIYGDIGVNSGSTGAVTIDGPGSTWTCHSYVSVGGRGSGTMSVTQGGAVTDTRGTIAATSGSTGVVTVTGQNSTWTNSNYLQVGYGGNGTLNISSGGTVSVGATTYVACQSGSTGTINFGTGGGTLITASLAASPTQLIGTGTICTNGLIADRNLTFDSTASLKRTFLDNAPNSNVTVELDLTNGTNGDLGAGWKGNGSLTVENGVGIHSRSGYLGYCSGSSGIATVTGTGSKWTTGTFDIGYGGSGSLLITNGGTVDHDASYSSRFSIGTSTGSAGVVTVAGAGSTWTNGGGELDVGYSGSGTLNINGGANVSDGGGYVGYSPGSIGIVRIDGVGSTWRNTSLLCVGESGGGTLTISRGGTASSSYAYIGFDTGATGVVTVDGPGSTWTNKSPNLSVGYLGKAILAVANGGTVAAPSIWIANKSSLAAIDAGCGSLLNVEGIYNDGTVRVVAGAGATAGVYTPISANTWGGTGKYQAVGGKWYTGSHKFTVSDAQTGVAGSQVSIDPYTIERMLITDSASHQSVGLSFLAAGAAGRQINVAASLMGDSPLAALQGSLTEGQSLLSAWNFSVTGAGYAAGDPAYLSLQIGAGYNRNDLEVWHYDGTAWTPFDTPDITYDGVYASFTVTGFSGYAVTAVPEPGTLSLLLAAGLGLLWFARRKRK
ncbi:MAG: PEP-CTERM sorting domain-containing protein [Thermoguttaceae bacterium]